MRGWVAFSQYLYESSTPLDTSHGCNLVVLDSICDRLGLQRSTVHSFLKHFASLVKTSFSHIATMVQVTDAEGQSYSDVLAGIYSKLRELSRMAVRLKPTESSMYDAWHVIITKRLRGFITLVIEPRIEIIRSGAPLVTAASSEQTPQAVKDGIRLNYLFELMQQKRQVPVVRYGFDQEPPSVGLPTLPTSPPQIHGGHISASMDQEHMLQDAAQLHKENQHLRAQVSALLQDNKLFQHTNETFVHKLALLGHEPPSTPISSSTQEDSDLLNSLV